MPGRKSDVYDGSYITAESAYRLNISGVDASVELDAGGNPIPTINLDLDMEEEIRNPGVSDPVYTRAAHGHDAIIGIFALPSAPTTTATIQLWRRVDDASGQVARTWAIAYAGNITGNTVLRVPNLIAGKYRIIVSALSAGTISLLTSRTL
jgi:hypothetical protein